MAGSVGLNKFYFGLALFAVVGFSVLWFARRQSDAGVNLQEIPLPAVASEDFAGYILGSDSAPLEITEYADFQCPACATLAVLTLPDVKNRLVSAGRVRWRFRDFPLDNLHRYTRTAHHAAACAAEQGLFWEMHDQLFFNQSVWAREGGVERKYRDYARAIGADVDRYNDCMRSGRYRARIQASLEEGLSVGVGSTPTLIIGNLRIASSIPYDRLKALVDSLSPPPSAQ